MLKIDLEDRVHSDLTSWITQSVNNKEKCSKKITKSANISIVVTVDSRIIVVFIILQKYVRIGVVN